MELSDQQVIELFSRLARIEAQLGTAPASCAVHSEQIRELGARVDDIELQVGKVETVIGRKELIVAAFGALGVGVGFAIKYLLAAVVK